MEKKLNYVIGPGGAKLTIENLPLPNTARWVPRKKAEIVAAVRGGLISLGEACDRYALTLEEFDAWQVAMDQFGLRGLRMTHSRAYRQQTPHFVSEKSYEETLPRGHFGMTVNRGRSAMARSSQTMEAAKG